MRRSIFLCWTIVLLCQLGCCALSGSTDEEKDTLGQILGLVRDIKGQLNNMEVKVGGLDSEIKEIKNQTLSSVEQIKAQLKDVKSQVVSTGEDLEDTVDTLDSHLLSVIQNKTVDVKEEKPSFESAAKITAETETDQKGNILRTIRCELTHPVADITIIDLSILASQSSCDVDTYTELAHINTWTQQVFFNSQGSTTDVSGSIDDDYATKSYISMTQNISGVSTKDYKCYRCVAQGFNTHGQPVTAYDTLEDIGSMTDDIMLMEIISVGVEANGQKVDVLTAEVNSKLDIIQGIVEEYRTNDSLHCNKMDLLDRLKDMNMNVSEQLTAVYEAVESERRDVMVQYENTTKYIDMFSDQLTASDVTVEVKNIKDKIVGIDATVGENNVKLGVLDTRVIELDGKIVALDTAVNGNSDKLGELSNAVSSLQTQLQTISSKVGGVQSIDDKIGKQPQVILGLHFDDSPFYRPNITHIYKGKLYLFTKDRKKFDIDGANEICKQYGGYLLEFDDEGEYEFIKDAVNPMYYDNIRYFFTGYTDRVTEGRYVHVHSGRELGINKWMSGRPDNAGGDEDCVEIYSYGSGLNDEDCDYTNGYICEVSYLV